MSKEKKTLDKQQNGNDFIADVSSSYIEIIKLADKIINGDKNTFGLINCLDHYYNGAFDDDLQKLEELKSKVGL